MSEREIPLMRMFLGAYSHPRVRLFRRQIIDRTVADIHTGRKFQVKAGIEGQADVYGFVKIEYNRTHHPVETPLGPGVRWTFGSCAVPFEIEFKGAKTRVSEEQKNWRRFCEEWSIPHIELRAGKDESQVETITRWIKEVNNFVSNLIPS